MTDSQQQQNILFLIDGLSGGGAERILLNLAAEMVQQNHQVTIISLRDDQAYPIPSGVDYILLEDHYRGPFWRQTEITRRARTLDRFLDSFFLNKKIDLAVSHLPKTDRIVAASRFLKEAWICLHCALTAGELENKKGFQRWRKRKQLITTYSGRKLITVSQALQEDVHAIGIRPTVMTTIYNPLDLEDVAHKAQEKSSFENEKFLLHVGRFNKQKRHDRLFEAFKLSSYPGKLILLGSGSDQEIKSIHLLAKKYHIEDRLVLPGFVNNPYSCMRAAEALVLSSDYEGLPNVLVEALACGTQVVSTNCPFGPAEILQGPLSQGLCDLTPSALAAAMRRVLTSPVPITKTMIAPFLLQESVHHYLELSNDDKKI
ncbi:MAG: glycosyltransferase [Verrucomicrobia bacterium]|nr:MAG: glycosyltransferase [Verrucomicrobiota bacterium]